MRLTRHIALAAGAVALTALSGCSLTSLGQSDDTDSADRTPVAASQAATSAPVAPATPVSSPSETATPASPAASASTSTAATTSAPAIGPVTTYSDKTGLLQLPVSNASLPGSPAGLRDFARAQLKKMWHDQFQDDPGCEGIGQVRIKRASATSAYVTVSWGATTPTCPQYAGNPGWWEIWGSQGGVWSLTLHGEGLASCSDLVEHRIARPIYPTCTDGSRKVPNPVA